MAKSPLLREWVATKARQEFLLSAGLTLAPMLADEIVAWRTHTAES